MAANIAKYLSATLTQGSADAFVEAAITTNLVPADGYAFKVSHIAYDGLLQAGVNNSYCEFAISRDTKTAVPHYDDPDTLFYFKRRAVFATSGLSLENVSDVLTLQNGIYIVEPTIYVDMDSSATAAVQTMNIRIYYEEVKLTEVEILRLLNNV